MERIDNTGFGDIRVIQNEGLGYGVDAILLAAFAAGETGAKGIPEGKGQRILDIGSGSGIIGFVLLHKIKDSTVIGVDVREGAVDRATRAAALNDLEDRISFELADCPMMTGFDAVVTNPPYFKKGSAVPNSGDDKYIARHETSAQLGDFIDAAYSALDKGGSLYMVHRPDRLVDILAEMRLRGIEPKELQMVTPHPGEAANIVLVHGIKGAGRELKVLPDIAIHKADGSYTEIIDRIYERK